MNEQNDISNQVSNPQQAVAEFVGEQFIEWVMAYIPHQMKTWPAIIKIASGQVKPEKIKKFMLQSFLAAEAFLGTREGDPGFLRFAIANLSESDDPIAESALEIFEKRREEETASYKIEKGVVQTAHRELWLRLLYALGATDEEIERAEPKEPTRNYIAELSDVYSNAEWPMAVGAFAAQERALPEEYAAIYQMLKKHTSLTDKDLEILKLHMGTDASYVISTGHILDKVVFDPESKQLVWDGIKRQLETREEYLNGLLKYYATS